MITLPPLATIKARALEALNNNALQCQKPGFEALKGCAYSGPCAIGAALHPNQIRALKNANKDKTGIYGLLDDEIVRVAPGDPVNATEEILSAIQDAHDWGNIDKLRELLEAP